MTPDQIDAATVMVLKWANSEGFAALHGAGADDGKIAEDLVMWLEAQDWFLISADDYLLPILN